MTEKLNYKSLSNKALTAEERSKLSPDDVLNILKQGNKEFAGNKLTIRNTSERIRQGALSQSPMAVVVSCMDSRVPVEDVFHRGLGDIFVVRIAGNFVNDDILDSLEIACKDSGAKLIVILGHEHCAAISLAIQHVESGNPTTKLSKIHPAVISAAAAFEGDKTSSNPAFVSAVCVKNVKNAITAIRTQNRTLQEMEAKGIIKIVGGIYTMSTGKVAFCKFN